MRTDSEVLMRALREIDEIERVLAEIEAEARRCNQAHRDVKPSFLLQRLAALRAFLKREDPPRE